MTTTTAAGNPMLQTGTTVIPADWPNARDSSRIQKGEQSWHVQHFGTGPTIVFLHGTGASTHSMAPLARHLAGSHTCLLIDLPGHGFSNVSGTLSLEAIATGLVDIVDDLTDSSYSIIGHSAGAAIAAQMAMIRPGPIDHITSINGAFLPFRGLAGVFFSPLARGLSKMPGVADLVAWRVRSRGAMERLIESTGSQLTAEQVGFYRRLLSDPARVRAILSMMAHWDLAGLARRLPCLTTPLLLLAASRDRTVAPEEAEVVAQLAANASVVSLPGVGHLAHEENPELIAQALPMPQKES